MTRTVHCRRYKEELEGLDRAPLPGPKGQEIFETVVEEGMARVAGGANNAY